jgi:hypothetical protein
LEFVSGERSAADAAVGSAPVSSASAEASQPAIYSRAQWGANESLRTGSCATPKYSSDIKVAFVHHTASANGYAAADVPVILRNLYAYDVTSAGYCDIPYNFLLDTYGRVWEGRAGGIDKAVLSGATGGFNTDSMSASLIGNFDVVSPPGATIDALESLLAWKLGIFYANPLGSAQLTAKGGSGTTAKYADGTTVTFDVVSGHRDAGSTACPGRYVYGLLPGIRGEVARLMGQGLAKPTLAVQPRTVATAGQVLVNAGLVAAGSWTLEARSIDGSLVSSVSGTGSAVAAAWPFTDPAGNALPNGEYQLTLTAAGNGQWARPWSAKARTGQAWGAVDLVSGGVGTVRFGGWAIMSDTQSPVEVEVAVDGAPSGRIKAEGSRPDVAAAYPGYGAAHGYDGSVAATTGDREVCVRVVDPASGQRSTIACRTVYVPASPSLTLRPGSPIGSFDVAVPTTGGIFVGGWALDPEASEPIAVHVYANSIGAALVADTSRPDVQSIYPAYGDRHGFGSVVPVPASGTYNVCAYAINVGQGGNSLLGCRPVAMAPNREPFGVVDWARGVPGGVEVAGWAIDPDTAASIDVHAYVGSVGRAVSAAIGRPDVAAAYPGYGSAHGYIASVPAPPGPQTICAYGINVPAGPNPAVGCRAVSVPGGNPYGAVDLVAGGVGSVTVAGWAIDPDTADSTSVHVYVGPVGYAVPAAAGRPDVGQVYPLYGAAHGFNAVVPSSSGPQNVCVYAINLGVGGHQLLRCQVASVS